MQFEIDDIDLSDVPDTSILLVTVEDVEGMIDSVLDALKERMPDSKCGVLFLQPGESLQEVPAEDMAKIGWFRKESNGKEESS